MSNTNPYAPSRFEENVIRAISLIARKQGEDMAQEAAYRTLKAAKSGSTISEGTPREVVAYMARAAESARVDEARVLSRSRPLAGCGWYRDPADPSGAIERYWTGLKWTERVRSRSGESCDAPPARLRRQSVSFGSLNVSPDDDERSVELAIVGSPADYPEEVLIAAETRSAVLAALSPLEGFVLYLAMDEGLNYEAIGRMIGRTAGGARSVHYRARQAALVALSSRDRS